MLALFGSRLGIARTLTLLPDPLSPTMPSVSPFCSVNESPRTAWILTKSLPLRTLKLTARLFTESKAECNELINVSPWSLFVFFSFNLLFLTILVWYGSKKSRKASPIKLKARVTPNRNHTGLNSQGNARKLEIVERSRLISEPQLTAGSVMPSPR